MSRTKRIYNKKSIGHNKWGDEEYHPYKELDTWCCRSHMWEFINAKRSRKLEERNETRNLLKNWQDEIYESMNICEDDFIFFLCFWPGDEPDYYPLVHFIYA